MPLVRHPVSWLAAGCRCLFTDIHGFFPQTDSELTIGELQQAALFVAHSLLSPVGLEQLREPLERANLEVTMTYMQRLIELASAGSARNIEPIQRHPLLLIVEDGDETATTPTANMRLP